MKMTFFFQQVVLKMCVADLLIIIGCLDRPHYQAHGRMLAPLRWRMAYPKEGEEEVEVVVEIPVGLRFLSFSESQRLAYGEQWLKTEEGRHAYRTACWKADCTYNIEGDTAIRGAVDSSDKGGKGANRGSKNAKSIPQKSTQKKSLRGEGKK